MSLLLCILSVLVALICESHGRKQVITLTRSQKNIIVNKHNAYRKKVTKGQMPGYGGKKHPRARNMIKLQWDEALAWSAANYAATCPGARHDKDSERKNRFTKARQFKQSFSPYDGTAPGQNMAFHTSKSVNTDDQLTSRIWAWYDVESPRVSFANTMKYGEAYCSKTPYSTKCGHFTNGAWAKTKYVGCGLTTGCDNFAYTFICNYYPSGNYMGQEVYQRGSTASNCPSGWRSVRDGLCAKGAAFTMEEEAEAEAKSTGLTLGIIGAGVGLIVVGCGSRVVR